MGVLQKPVVTSKPASSMLSSLTSLIRPTTSLAKTEQPTSVQVRRVPKMPAGAWCAA